MAREKEVSKVDRACEMFQELKGEGKLKTKDIYEKMPEELGITVDSARGYVWRKESPEEYEALLQRYFAKKKAKAEKAEAEKQKKTNAEE